MESDETTCQKKRLPVIGKWHLPELFCVLILATLIAITAAVFFSAVVFDADIPQTPMTEDSQFRNYPAFGGGR